MGDMHHTSDSRAPRGGWASETANESSAARADRRPPGSEGGLPSPYRFLTLGGMAVEGPHGPLAGRVAHRHPLALLALLAAGCDERCTRDKLIGYLWGECDEHRARHALADTLYILRSTLGSDIVRSIGPVLQLDTEAIWTDVGAFEAAIGRGDLEGAVTLYRGPFLDGFYLQGALEFEHWLDSKRQHFERRCREALLSLAERAESGGDYERAISWWQRAAELCPYDPEVALRLCEAFAAVGDRAAALKTLLDYEGRLQRDLGIEPDGAVLAVKESVLSSGNGANHAPGRRGPPLRPDAPLRTNGTPVHAPSAGADGDSTPTPNRRHRFGVIVGLATVGVALGAGAFRVLSPSPPVRLDPDQLVVLAFDRVTETVDPLLATGLARLVSLTLDGAGPLRTVSPAEPRSEASGAADDRSIQRAAEEAGAGLVLASEVAPLGAESLTVRAVLHDATLRQPLSSFKVRGANGNPQALADSISVAVMRELAGRRFFGAWRLSSMGSASPDALRNFLRGEWYLRRFKLDSARQYYGQAIAEDSGFALAYRGWVEVEAWQTHFLGGSSDLALRAGRLNHGLAPRESLLLTIDSLGGAIVASGGTVPPPALARRLLLTLGDWTEAYPRDPEAWYRLGDAEYHIGMLIGASYANAGDALRRAIEIDSGYAAPYLHKIELDLALEGAVAALSTARAALALEPDEPWRGALRIVVDLLDPARAASLEVARDLRARAAEAHPRYLPREPATYSLMLAYHILNWSVEPGEPALRVARAWGYPNAIALAAAYRGHLAEAYLALTGDDVEWSIPGSSREGFFAALARLGAVPAATAARTFGRWLDAGDPWGAYNALRWWSATGDTASLRRAAGLFDAMARDTRASNSSLGTYGSLAARAYLTLALGDTATAVERLSGLALWCWGHECHQEALTLARLLAGLGRDREALQQYARVPTPIHRAPSPEAVMIAFERGRLQERLGQRIDAVRSYEYVAAAWRGADPTIRRYAEAALEGLKRLSSGGRSQTVDHSRHAPRGHPARGT